MSKRADKKKIRFYHDGTATVCLLLDAAGEVVARGISVRSRLDEFYAAEGRRIAYNRALEAAGRKANCGRILLDKKSKVFIDNLALSLTIDRFGPFKGYWCPQLTSTETLLLTNKLNMEHI